MDFNLNSINKKIALYLSLVGFILSFISGLISGNRFGDLFIRSIISGIVIGIVIVIVNIVIVLYLPELLVSEDDEDSDDLESDSHINIVMPEEKYKVQAGDIDDSESDRDEINTSFKEVGLDNLESLSSSSNGNYTNEVENFSDDSGSFSQSSSNDVDTDIGKHSVEEMTKAVKTVLKKD